MPDSDEDRAHVEPIQGNRRLRWSLRLGQQRQRRIGIGHLSLDDLVCLVDVYNEIPQYLPNFVIVLFHPLPNFVIRNFYFHCQPVLINCSQDLACPAEIMLDEMDLLIPFVFFILILFFDFTSRPIPCSRFVIVSPLTCKCGAFAQNTFKCK